MNFFRKQKQEVATLTEELNQNRALLSAIENSVAKIEFSPEGVILAVNDIFLSVIGYQRADVLGQHHRIFCHKDLVNSKQYQEFWRDLNRGKAQFGHFERINKSGQMIWLDATYFPVQEQGKTTRIVKIATDITAQKLTLQSQTAIAKALDKSMATIEFTPEGVILDANKNFTDTLGYSLYEIKGKHHKLFCEDEFYREQPDFWLELSRGEHKSGRFHRLGKHRQDIWIEATYNPIFDAHGKVVKVIKFATNITERVQRAKRTAQAAEVAQTTAQHTEQITEHASTLLAHSVQTSDLISNQVQGAMDAIAQLNEQSKGITAIVSTISAIAEQTNLLALNAAIEAARAGEQGRGFAVVADEVRNLAARTSQSTREINEVVSTNEALTQQSTEQMLAIAESTQRGLSQIEEINDVMKQIKEGAEHLTNTVKGLSA